MGGFHSSQATITDDSTVIEYDGAISSWRSTLISIWFDLDVVGMVLFLVGAGAFLVAITLAGNLNPWNSREYSSLFWSRATVLKIEQFI